MKFRYKYNKEEIIKKMSEEHYNGKTKTLTLPYNFNEELTDLPLETMTIIFEEDLKKLANACGVENRNIEIKSEAEGVNLFIHINNANQGLN